MDQRPLNINPLSIHLPLNAWVSVLHRMTGVLLAVSLPLVLLALSCSLKNSEGFARVIADAGTLWGRLLLWAWLSTWWYHVLAGVRHLLMDLHWGTHPRQATFSSFMVLVLAGVASAAMAWCLWFAEVVA